MNKLFTKIAALALGMTMATGVGVAVASSSKEASPADAADYTGTFVGTTDITTLSAGDIIVIANNNNKAMSNGNGTSAAPSATSVTVSSNTITNPDSSLIWTFGISSGNYTFLAGTSGSNYLYCTSTNNGVRVGTNSNNTFIVDGGYLKNVATSRFVGVYNNADWRCYTSSGGNIANQTFTYYKLQSKSLDSISLGGTYATTFTVGDPFDHEGMTVTAHYSDSSSANVTSSATWSSPDMSTSGTKQVTVSYSGKSATYNITVNAPVDPTNPTISGTASADKGGEWNLSGLTVTDGGTLGDITDKCVLTSSNSTATPGETTITVHINYRNGQWEGNVSGVSATIRNVTSVTDTINYAFTGISGSGYTAWSNKEGTSGAVYAGQSNAGVSYVQIRATSPSGIVSTTSGGTAKSAKVTWGGSNTNGRVVTFYGKNTAYSEPADLYDNDKIGTPTGSVTFSTGASTATATLTGDYSFIGIKSNGAAYMTSIEITWSQEQEEKEIESISVSDNSGKSWYAGDTLNASDLSVEVTYDTGDPVTITDGTGVYFDSNHTQTTYTLSQGANSITVYYTDEFGSVDNSEEPLSITAGAARNLSSIAISTPPTKTIYEAGETFDASGMVVTASFTAGPTANVSSEVTISPSGALTVGTTSVTVSYTYKGTTRTATQAITVNAAPVSIVFGPNSGQWKPTASGSTFVDSKGNTATLTTDTSYFGSTRPIQVGKNDKDGVVYKATYVDIVIPLSEKAGIDKVSATFKSNGSSSSVTLYIYGDTDNDLLASGTVTGNSELGTVETASSYEKINASRLKYHFVIGGTGVMLDELKYTLGSTVTDFGPMVALEISTPASNTQFKEGDTFSGAGLVLLATDSHVPPMTKHLTSGFKFGTSQGDDSFTNHVFDATDAQTGTFTVHVTATEGAVTMEVTYTITVTEVPTYSPVTDYSSLYEGAKVLIVSDGKAFGEYGINQGSAVTPVFTDDDITDANGATEFTIRIYGDKFGLQFGTYFLALNGENKQVHRNLTLTDAGAWEKDSTGIAAPIDGWYLGYDSSKSGFICASDGSVTASALYISDKAPKTALLGAETFAYKYLHMRDYDPELHEGVPGAGYCSDSTNHYYSTAKAFYNSASFSAAEKVQFAGLTDAVARLQAWARANGESFDPSTGFGNANNRINPIANLGFKSANTMTVIIIVSLVAAGTVGGYFFIRKRKEN